MRSSARQFIFPTQQMSSISAKLILIIACALSGLLIACGGSGGGSSSVDISGEITADGAVVALSGEREKTFFVAFKDFEFVEKAFAQDEELSEPLGGATVELLGPDGTVLLTTTTDENGKFIFKDVAPGTYALQVSDPSIEPLIIEGVTVLEGDETIVKGRVTLEGAEVSVDFSVSECGFVNENKGQLGHAQALADATGMTVDDIISIRETECIGWGVIAQQLEVSPGTLGLGNSNSNGGGRPEGVGGGRPEGAGGGRPDDVGGGRPENAGGGRPS